MEVCPPKVVKCDECETARKDLKVIHHCPSCEQYLCDPCDKKMHGRGKRIAHERKEMATHTHFAPGTPPVAAHGGIPDSVSKCDECEGPRDTVKVRCDACEQWLCDKCNTKLHKAGKRMAHVRKYFGGGSAPPVQGDKEVAPASVKACSECETPRSELEVICQCEPCEQWLCETCDDKLHKKGKRMAHIRKHFNTKDAASPSNAPDLAPAAATKCDECEATRDSLDNLVRCDACEQWLCPACDEKMHKKGKRIAHERHAYVTKVGAKPLAPKAKPTPAPETPKSPTRQSAASNATLSRAPSRAKDREEETKDDSKEKAAAAAAKKKADAQKAEEEAKRKEEEKQKAAAEKERLDRERTEAEKAKAERERKRKEDEEKRAKEKAALEEKKKRDEEELRLKIEQETREQLEREEAEKEKLKKEKAERKKAREEKRRIKAEKQAKKEAEEKAAAEKAEAERLLREKAEGELRAKLEAEARAKVEAEMRAKVEAEMRAKQEEEERQREKKERAERRAREEKERAEKKAKEEAEKQERIRKEKAELERKAEEERLRLEREEQEAKEQLEREEREAEEKEKERQREAAEAAEKARNAAASPKRRPPTIVNKASASTKSLVGKPTPRSGGGGGDEEGFGLGDFDDDEEPPASGSGEKTTGSASAAPVVDLGPEEDVNFLKKGVIATKHDISFGKKTQKRDMWYEPGVNGGNLQWGRPGEKRVADKKKQLAMVAIQEVYVGKSSASFKKIKEGADPACFSIVSKERCLDVECQSESERDSFVRAIQHICKEHMISIQMHGSPKPRPTPQAASPGKTKKASIAGAAGARAMSPSTAGARAVSPSNAKRPTPGGASIRGTVDVGSKASMIGDERAAPRKKPAAGDKRVCDDCLDPGATLAVQCEECEQVLCADCDQRIHKKGTRAAHQRGPYVEAAAGTPAAEVTTTTKHVCQDCNDSANEVVCHCAECEQFLCHDCDLRIHKKGTRSKHVRDYLDATPPTPTSASSTGSNSGSASRESALSPGKANGKTESDSKEMLGNQAFNNKKYDKAAGFFSELISQNPSGYKYFLKRCNCYFFLDKFAEALSDANTAIDLAPQVMEGYVLKGKSLDKLGKTADAITAVQEGLRIEPANIELKKALAKLKDEASQPPPAEPAPAAAKAGKGHVRQPSRPPPPPNKAPPSTAVSGAGGKKGPPPLPTGKAATGKKEPPPLKKKEDIKKKEEPERVLSPSKAAKKEKVEEEAPPPAAEEEAPPPPEGGDEWQEHIDPSTGNKYWHNTNTQETTWDDPHNKGAAAEEEWGEAKDPATGKTYWFNTKTGATTWENPHGSEWAESADPATGKPFWYHIVTGQTTWDNPAEAGKKKEPVSAAGPAVPVGMAVPKVVTVKNSEWSEHKDASSGNVYYVNNKTQATTWSNPHQWNEWVDKATGKKYWNNEVTGVTTWEYPK